MTSEVMTTPGPPQGRGGHRCGVSRKGKPACKLPAGWGTATPGIGPCRKHGGATRNHRKHAEVVQAEQALASLGMPVRRVENPLHELQALAGEVLGWKDMLAAKVADLQSHTIGDLATVRGEVVLFERAMDRCTRTLEVIGRLNIDARLAAVTSGQVETFQACQVAGLGAYNATLELTAEQVPRVPAAAEAMRQAVAAEVERRLSARVIEGRAS